MQLIISALLPSPLFRVQRTAEGILRVGLADPARIEAALDALFGRPTVNVLVADATKLSAEDRAKRDEINKGWANLSKRLAKAAPPPPPTTLDEATRYGPCAHSPPMPALNTPSHLTFVPSWGLSRLLAWYLQAPHCLARSPPRRRAADEAAPLDGRISAQVRTRTSPAPPAQRRHSISGSPLTTCVVAGDGL